MRLFHNPRSPFARKVRVAVRELGLESEVDEIEIGVSPVERDPAHVARNPLGRIPVLERDDGTTLYDSTVILQFLDAYGGGRLLPDGDPRWVALTRASLVEGMIEAAVNLRYETMLRPSEKRWPAWIDGQWAKIDAGLARLEEEAPGSEDGFAMVEIGLACFLGYLDFRFADRPWRRDHSRLAHWYDAASARPSMRATVPS